MRLVVWNILHGGGPRRVPEIGLALVERHADVVVLLEFRTPRGGQLRAVLADAGLVHQLASPAPAGRNGILIASRWPLRQHPQLVVCQELAPKFMAVMGDTPAHGTLTFIGVHVPDDGSPTTRAKAWQRLVEVARSQTMRTIIAGDLNTGRHRIDEIGETFSHTQSLGELAMAGYVDVWRGLNPSSRERTWGGIPGCHGRPFDRQPGGSRIDAVWASPDLAARALSATLSHAERESGISDHSLLCVDFHGETGPESG